MLISSPCQLSHVLAYHNEQTPSKRKKSISLFAFQRKDGKFVYMDNAYIMALGFIRPELISVNVVPK